MSSFRARETNDSGRASRFRLALLVCAASVVSGGEFYLSSAPELGQGAGQPKPLVILGTVAAVAGEDVQIPLIYQAGAEEPLSSLIIQAEFEAASVSFVSAEKGNASELLDYDLVAEIQESDPGDQEDRTRVELRLVSKSESLPRGVLASLKFHSSPDAPPGNVSLSFVSLSAIGPSGDKAELDAEGGMIILTEPLLTACFFFMH